MRRFTVILILLTLCLGAAQARLIRPLVGLAVGARAGYWNHAGASHFFDNGVDAGVKIGYRFDPGELELTAFFDYCHILPKEGGRLGNDTSASLMTFGVVSRIIFVPDNWITPFVAAGPSFQLRSTGLDRPIDRDEFSYYNNAADFSVTVDFGIEFPLPPTSNIELGTRLHHVFASSNEEGFAGISVHLAYTYFF